MSEQDRTPDTADEDTTGHLGRGNPGDSERESEDDTTGHGGRYHPGDSEREDDEDDNIGNGGPQVR